MNRKLNTEEIVRVSIDEYRDIPKIPLVVLLDNVRSMHNIGSVFRTADAFRVEKVILCGITATPPHNEIHKSALGAEYSVEWQYADDSRNIVERLANEGYIPIAIEQTEQSVALNHFDIDKSNRYVVVFGNEVFGVGQPTIDACRYSIDIPQAGTKHSLNVSVAAGIVIYDFFEKLTMYTRCLKRAQ